MNFTVLKDMMAEMPADEQTSVAQLVESLSDGDFSSDCIFLKERFRKYFDSLDKIAKTNNCYRTNDKIESSSFLTKVFFAFPTFQPSLSTLPMSIIHTPSHGHLSKLQGTGYKEERSGMQHNAPTHLPHYCIFRLVELSLAQFDYIQSAEM